MLRNPIRRGLVAALLAVIQPVGECAAEEQAPELTGAAEEQAPELTATMPTLEEALQSPPPGRSAIGRAFANDENRLREIDQWIEQTTVDAPKNLVLRDLLLAMPIATSGPLLVKLASKSREPAIQSSWKRHLEKYPGPYAGVLATWMMAESDNPQRFLSLFKEYAAVRPAQASSLWASLVKNNASRKLGPVFEYGLSMPGSLPALQKELSIAPDDETQKLRLFRAVTLCSAMQPQIVLPPPPDHVVQDIARLLSAKAVSRRIVALDAAAAYHLQSLVPTALSLFKTASNSTERSHILTMLVHLNPADHMEDVRRSLENGDEILRLTAAELIEHTPELHDGMARETLLAAFNKEIWPDAQLSLYHSLVRRNDDPEFVRNVLLGSQFATVTRMAAVRDLNDRDAASLTLNDMASLQRNQAPIELIAAVAEAIFTHHPENRNTLRSWISVQHPFERRLLLTFSRFVATDSRESAETLPYVRDVCSHAVEDESILHPCIAYFEDHSSTDDDHKLLTQLRTRRKQFDMMLDL